MNSFTTKKIPEKRELWESRLLDLTLRNMLLNLSGRTSAVPVLSSHVDELEDALADGQEFLLMPAPEWLASETVAKTDAQGGTEEVPWFQEVRRQGSLLELARRLSEADSDNSEKIRQGYDNHRLFTFSEPVKLEKELTKIYRTARSSQLENGVSSLYIAAGLLRWYPEQRSTACYAPLILLPAEMVRKPAGQGYALRLRDEEAQFNSTLLELLRRQFSLEIEGLEPLPADEHGIDIRKVFSLVRDSLVSLKNWDVAEICVLGNFSFAQFAIWNDIHTAGDLLEKSRIVRSLMKGRIDWENTQEEAEENAGKEQAQPFPLAVAADEAQLEAIRTAVRGTTFVLHGPPGTGKSQTITGMIAALLYSGKRVLFAAEKMAALSVVQRRLEGLGIGDFCLELHSDKANKKHVLRQLARALEAELPEEQPEYGAEIAGFEENRRRLDEYARHLHARRRCGYTLRELADLYESVRETEHSVEYSRELAAALTKEEIRNHASLVARLTAAGEILGGMEGNPLVGVGLSSYGAEVRSALQNHIVRFKKLLGETKRGAADVTQLLGQKMPRKKEEYEALSGVTDLFFAAAEAPAVYGTVLKGGRDALLSWYAKEGAARAEEGALLKTWKQEFLGIDTAGYLEKHEKAGKKFFGKQAAKDALTAELQAFAVRPLTFEEIPGLLTMTETHRKNRAALQAAYDVLPENAKETARLIPTGEEYEACYASARALYAKAEHFPGGAEMLRWLAGDAAAVQVFSGFRDSFRELVSEEAALNGLLLREESAGGPDWIGKELAFCVYMEEHPGALKDLGLYNEVRQECMQAGLKPAVEAYEKGLPAAELPDALKKGLSRALILEIISGDDVLSSFSGASFEEMVRQFRRMDEEVTAKTRTEILRKLVSRVPTPWTSPEAGTELTLLRKAIGSGARNLSIRRLFDRIPHVLPYLCPCMLMSPNSVAQYLSQQNDLFDVVIFDEASQLPTCKAAGALYRAKDAVIVGDPNQMPPTAFFSGSGPEVEDLELDDLDSVLEDALALGVPSLYLKWHYRSTHESLIAFSNRHFYENRMRTFPSADDREQRVKTVHVDGVYRNGTNPMEAEAVVQEIVRRFHDPALRSQTVGVVTFNVKQQALIENLLMRLYQKDPALDEWANGGDDPLFVKNLENVQGDERDAILFSITYGPDENGRISMNFGPINQEGGGKRLNVAFSRSRVSMTIFASMRPEDMKVTENSPEGVVAFRDFLVYAERGGAGVRAEGAGEASEAKRDASRGPGSSMERDGILRSVRRAAEDFGFRCETMVGHSDFRVDLAVTDPYDPERYLLGILLDGESYRRTANTRDREVSQESVLKNLGWTIHRIWTVDWWDNRDRELKKLKEKLLRMKQQAGERAAEREAKREAGREQQAALEAEAKAFEEQIHAETAAAEAEVIAEEESKMYNNIQ